MVIQERYHATAMAANTSLVLTGCGIGGFAAVTAGTLSVTHANSAVLLAAFPVAAGGVYRIPILTGDTGGGLVTLAGGASGTIFKQ